MAASEPTTLKLDVAAEMATALVVPEIGDAVTVQLDGNAFEWPALDVPGAYRVEWRAAGSDDAAAACSVEAVSRHYFALADLKGYGDGRDEFDKLADEVLWDARQAATDVFEEAACRSFVPRLGRTRDFGGANLLAVHHDVQRVITVGYAQVSDSYLERKCRPGTLPTWVRYVYGLDSPPAAVSRAVLDLAAYMLRPANRPIGATGESTDAGYIHFTTAGRDGATAIPEVNAAIQQYGAGERYIW